MKKTVGLGTFPLTSAFKILSEFERQSILTSYFDAGGRYIDVAPTYGAGNIEKIVGEVLQRKNRDTFEVSTSCGYILRKGKFEISGKPEHVLEDLEGSLERLQLEFVDVYISHIPDLNTPLEETADALQSILESGKAKRIGVSNVSAEQLKRYASVADISIVQNRFSMINRDISNEMIEALSATKATLVAYQVIERGLLSTRGPSLTNPSDLRKRKPEFVPDRIAKIRQYVETKIRPIAKSIDLTLEELAIAWVLSKPYVEIAQIGATSTEDASALASFDKCLPQAILDEIDETYAECTDGLKADGYKSLRGYMGLDDYDIRSGSATGK